MKLIVAPLLLLASTAVSAADKAANQPAPPADNIKLHAGAAPASATLIATLAEKDRQLFDAAFNCKLELLATLVADDLEFFHDKWGQTAKSGKEFMEDAAKGCAQQKAGTDFKARRELVEGSMTVHVINKYGAMQMGTHRFFALQAGKPDRLTETGKFIDLWKEENGQWKLARVISYDHVLADSK